MLIRRLSPLPAWSESFRTLDAARREMERIFDSLNEIPGFRTAGVFPAINVTENAEALFVRAELPGLDPQNLEITVEKNTLTLAGERTIPAETDDVSYHRREREWGRFRRSVTLPVRVNAEKVRASYRDGVLTVEMPKAPEARPRQITVQAGA